MKKWLGRVRYELDAYWRSDASTVHGAILGVVGLTGSAVGRHALETLGVPARLVHFAAAIAVVAGAILVTPRHKDEEL